VADYYREHLKAALFHTKACATCIRKAAAVMGAPLDDEPLDDDLPDYEPTPDPPLLPRGKYPRLVG
jgi:hypothetical protein